MIGSLAPWSGNLVLPLSGDGFSSAPDEPRCVVERTVQPWLKPQTPEEKVGLVPHVTFVEGLVRFQDRWFAYDGQSDTTTGVAVSTAAS